MCFAPQRCALFRHRMAFESSKSGPSMRCFVHFHVEMCFAPHARALLRHLNVQKWSDTDVFCTFSLPNVLRATRACTFWTSPRPKVVRGCGVLYVFTSKCASRHTRVHFFNISTSKSGPRMLCFVHFHVEMCFAPHARALFQHPNFQKSSGPDVFCTFSLPNVHRATRACTFCTSQLPKVLREWCVLPLFTSKCTSRHTRVQLFISQLPRCLRTRRFSEPTFRPSGATEPWENTVFRDFPTFSRTCIFSLSSLLTSDFLASHLLFHLSILSEA